MSPKRPSAPKPAPFITEAGHKALQEELKALWKRRAGVTRALAAAAAEGDRSENAEYIYRKKQLRGIDHRIRYLQRRLPVLRIVSEPPSDQRRVFFGAWVTLEQDDGRQVAYRLVGADEADPLKGWISIDSPMARALMRRTLDEEIRVCTPGGEVRYTLTGIAYDAP